jgi:hypothetical protein
MSIQPTEISSGYQSINDWYLATPKDKRSLLEHTDRLLTRLSLRWGTDHWEEFHRATVRGEQRQLRFESLPQSDNIWPMRNGSQRCVKIATQDERDISDWEEATQDRPLEARVYVIDVLPPRKR